MSTAHTTEATAASKTEAAMECEAALDMPLEQGVAVLARYGFQHDGCGRDQVTRLSASQFIERVIGATGSMS